ncbi:unnamed protein product [Amoebophrya sp. A120]|nr:unnamed protein product [Amoebophrya sp. A120]|eukprot:GSA120T00021648001.1
MSKATKKKKGKMHDPVPEEAFSSAANVLSNEDLLGTCIAPFLQVKDLGRVAQVCKSIHSAAVSPEGKLAVPVHVIQVTIPAQPRLGEGLPPTVSAPFLSGFNLRHLRVLRVAVNRRGKDLALDGDDDNGAVVCPTFVCAALEGLQPFLHSASSVEVVACPLVVRPGEKDLPMNLRQSIGRSLFVLPALRVLEIPAELALAPLHIFSGKGSKHSIAGSQLQSLQIYDASLTDWGLLEESSLVFRLVSGLGVAKLEDFGFAFGWSNTARPKKGPHWMVRVDSSGAPVGQRFFEKVLPGVEILRLFCCGKELFQQPWFSAISMPRLKKVQYGDPVRLKMQQLPVKNVLRFPALEALHFHGVALDVNEFPHWRKFFAGLALRHLRFDRVRMSVMQLGLLSGLLAEEVGTLKSLSRDCRDRLLAQVDAEIALVATKQQPPAEVVLERPPRCRVSSLPIEGQVRRDGLF